MAVNDTTCSNSPAFQHLRCNDIQVADGIALENHIFLVSQLPCCAQLALPYWAKITGRISNNQSEEALLSVVVTLFDDEGSTLEDYTDVIALDGGQQGEFEVKLVEHHDRAEIYTIIIKQREQL
jgi:hypothetical protein